jgi:imidazolonepropionase-like amidohydrolase
MIGRGSKTPRGAKVIDGRGKFLIPGLWDMHVHIFNNSHQAGTDNHKTYFPLLIANGVTGVRDMWTDADDQKLVRQWQSEMAAGRLLAPRIAPGSHIIDGWPTHRPNMLPVVTPDEARRAVRAQKEAGAGFIKVYWRLTPDVYAAIADESKKLGIPFAGHVPFAISAATASNSGQKSIEHLTGILETCSSNEDELRKATNLTPPQMTEQLWRTYDEKKCTDLFRLFAKNRTWQMPNAVLHRMLAFRREESFRNDPRLKYVTRAEAEEWSSPPTQPQVFTLETRKQRFDRLLETISRMHKLGVPILAGTDLGNPLMFAGFSLHDELELLVRAGLTPYEALQTATVNPSKYLERERELGTIEKGKLADLVLLDADPLADINNTRKINAVVVNGRLLERPALDELLSEVEGKLKDPQP